MIDINQFLLFLTLLIILPLISCSGLCPLKWKQFKDTCYTIRDELSNAQNLTSDCREECGRVKMFENLCSPLVIKNPGEEVFLLENYGNHTLWLGAKMDEEKGEFKWSDSGNMINTDWTLIPGSGNCLSMHNIIGNSWHWEKTDCEEQHYGVCQMPQILSEEIILKIMEQLYSTTPKPNYLSDSINTSISILIETQRKLNDLLNPKRSCNEFDKSEHGSGIYTIHPDPDEISSIPVRIYCDMVSFDGGWTTIQRRGFPPNIPKANRTNFYRGWDDYKNGFGNSRGDYWIGLENIHLLTRNCTTELLVNLTRWDGSNVFAKYSSFQIQSEIYNYRINISGYSGTAGDSLISIHNGMQFTTFDKDNDERRDGNEAVFRYGGWWYQSSAKSNLNGDYGMDGMGWKISVADLASFSTYGFPVNNGHNEIFWRSDTRASSYQKTEMKIRSNC